MQVAGLHHPDDGVLGHIARAHLDRLMIQGVKGLAGFNGDALNPRLGQHT
jgi:hypothetical protein